MWIKRGIALSVSWAFNATSSSLTFNVPLPSLSLSYQYFSLRARGELFQESLKNIPRVLPRDIDYFVYLQYANPISLFILLAIVYSKLAGRFSDSPQRPPPRVSLASPEPKAKYPRELEWKELSLVSSNSSLLTKCERSFRGVFSEI